MTSRNNNTQSSRELQKRGIRETIEGRIPKKIRRRSDSNGSAGSQREEEGAIVGNEEALLDPVAAARKALEMFQEVSGEPVLSEEAKTSIEADERGQRNEPVGRDTENSQEKKKIEEEKAKQKERMEAGEAIRRKFQPKIVSLQESNCLL